MSMVGGLVNPSGYCGVMPPPKKKPTFFLFKKNVIASLATRILWTYAPKKCVFQYHEYGKRPGKR